MMSKVGYVEINEPFDVDNPNERPVADEVYIIKSYNPELTIPWIEGKSFKYSLFWWAMMTADRLFNDYKKCECAGECSEDQEKNCNCG